MLSATALASDDFLDLDEILVRHGIPASFKSAYELLIESGQIASDDFRYRLKNFPNYQTCADEVLEAFPEPDHFFRQEN